MKRAYLSWYNHPRKFSNGIVWVRAYVRIGRWWCIGGLWWSKHWPFLRVLLPGRGKAPIEVRVERYDASPEEDA